MTARTLIYAHRGAKREAAENTRSAFERALAYPIDGIETDVQLSRDEVAVLWHDDDLKKLKLYGRHIDDFIYEHLHAMNFAMHFVPAIAPETLMTLQAFVEAYRERCGLLLEIKYRAGELRARQQIKVQQALALAGEAAGERILVSSFDLDSVLYAQSIAPGFPLVLNLEPEQDVNFARRILDDNVFLHGLCVHISTLDADMMRVVRERGKRIAVYTCNSDAEIERALLLGVDILISDVPQQALRLRDR